MGKIRPGRPAALPRDETLRADYRRLIGIRRGHHALSRGVHTGLVAEQDLLVFLRRDAESKDAVVVALNRGDSTAATTFKAPEEWAGKPVIAINTATYWHALRQNGILDKIPGLGRLLEEF